MKGQKIGLKVFIMLLVFSMFSPITSAQVVWVDGGLIGDVLLSGTHEYREHLPALHDVRAGRTRLTPPLRIPSGDRGAVPRAGYASPLVLSMVRTVDSGMIRLRGTRAGNRSCRDRGARRG